MRKPLSIVSSIALSVGLLAGPALSQEAIRKIELLSRPQAAQPAEFQAMELVAQEWRKLGLDVEVKVMPWEQLSDV
nr:hypothetical protein [Paracoccaceae bacterium]